TIGKTLQQSITQFIRSVVLLLGITIMMFPISALLTVVALVSLPLSRFVIRPFLKRSQQSFLRQQNTLGHLNGHVAEMYKGHQTVQAYGQEKYALEEFDHVNEQLYDAGRRAQFISGINMPIMMFIGNLTYVAISIIGGLLVIQRVIAIGDIQAFITYTRQFNQPINQIANIANIIQQTIAAAERVFHLIDEEEEIPDTPAGEITSANGAVRFEHVQFGYDDTL